MAAKAEPSDALLLLPLLTSYQLNNFQAYQAKGASHNIPIQAAPQEQPVALP